MKRSIVVASLLLAVTPCLALGDDPRESWFRVALEKWIAWTEGSDSNGGPEFQADLLGASEVPPVDTATEGRFEIKFNEDFTAAEFEVEVFDGIAITQAHLHCAPAGVNGPVVVFLFGNVPGGFDVDGDLAEFTITDANIAAVNADCTNAIGRDINTLADLADAAADGLIYANVHSVAHPGGEVRGQLVPEDDDDDGDDGDDDDDDDGDDD